MVNDHYPYEMAISLGIYPIFRQTHLSMQAEQMDPSAANVLTVYGIG